MINTMHGGVHVRNRTGHQVVCANHSFMKKNRQTNPNHEAETKLKAGRGQDEAQTENQRQIQFCRNQRQKRDHA